MLTRTIDQRDHRCPTIASLHWLPDLQEEEKLHHNQKKPHHIIECLGPAPCWGLEADTRSTFKVMLMCIIKIITSISVYTVITIATVLMLHRRLMIAMIPLEMYTDHPPHWRPSVICQMYLLEWSLCVFHSSFYLPYFYLNTSSPPYFPGWQDDCPTSALTCTRFPSSK